MRSFNTTGVCVPDKHYMVDLKDRVQKIAKLVADGRYFAINRARQYGKTTTLLALQRYLEHEYLVISLSLQGLGSGSLVSEREFVKALCRLIRGRKRVGLRIPTEIDARLAEYVEERRDASLVAMFDTLLDWCALSELPIVLLLDEIDGASDSQAFMDFLAQLRDGYISRDAYGLRTFHSVILAGVADVRHLRERIRNEDQHRVNSPWNIATDFDVEMAFSADGIRGMLDEYERDCATGMDTMAIASQIHAYTSGYPYLVSRICQLVDERLGRQWTVFGVDEAVRMMLSENNALFDSLMGRLMNHPELSRRLRGMLLRGDSVAWLPDDDEQRQLAMYGFVRNEHNKLRIANRVFEMRLYAHFVGEGDRFEALRQSAAASGSIFVDEEGGLDIPKIMAHFIREHGRIHGEPSKRFLEEEGRERFLTYLAPIINGTGTYDVEPQTRDHRRMDVVVHWLGRRYVIELKIWRGDRYNAAGERQVAGYLDFFGLDVGYMLSFDFRRSAHPGVKRIQVGDKVLFEGIV